MGLLIPINYGTKKYPSGIIAALKEVPAHFDRKYVDAISPFSLHTEFSYGARSFSSPAISNDSNIRQNHIAGIPQLWCSDGWSAEFAQFIFRICNGKVPDIIEVHPPFSNYSDIERFLKCFFVFERKVLLQYPNVKILIENRYGTLNRTPFILSNAKQLLEFSNALDNADTSLRITLDLPQLLGAERISPSREDEMIVLLRQMRTIRHNIGGIHLWGRKNGSAHIGDLNTWFRGHGYVKQSFLNELKDLLDDNVPRVFVPEVNGSQEDFDSIIADVLSCGIKFC